MSRNILNFCGTTLLRFSKNDPVLTRVSEGYPLSNCQRKVKHLGLWEVKPRPPPKATGPQKTPEYSIDYSVSQLPVPSRHLPGGTDKWLYVDPQYPEVFPP